MMYSGSAGTGQTLVWLIRHSALSGNRVLSPLCILQNQSHLQFLFSENVTQHLMYNEVKI